MLQAAALKPVELLCSCSKTFFPLQAYACHHGISHIQKALWVSIDVWWVGKSHLNSRDVSLKNLSKTSEYGKTQIILLPLSHRIPLGL